MTSRYREARTLVRRLCRLPGEDQADFKRKIARLREHFERFNVDVSELCQWLMGLRRQYADVSTPASFGVLGDFLLAPGLPGFEADESQRDRWRLAVFDDVAGFRTATALGGQAIPDSLRQAMNAAAGGGPHTNRANATAARLFARLRALEPAHRLVLLKSAADWVVARYQRAMENWQRQHEEWEKEKREWERRHPELTDRVRERFTQVFQSLVWDRERPPGVRSKRPRICPYERMRGNMDNCIYAGEKGHGPLCWKYAEFAKARQATCRRFNAGKFAEDSTEFLRLRRSGIARHAAFRQLFPRDQTGPQRFSDNWTEYLRALDLREETVIQRGEMPHCRKIGGTWEQSQCRWNPHTELCRQYKVKLDQFDEATVRLEPLYRQWRRHYLAGPRRPSFRYPSSRELPMPKIFGAGFHQVDFDRSVLRLRLDDMAEGQWIEFGFTPWPRDYKPSRDEIKVNGRVTSVHVNFVGTRARVGFRFEAPRSPSRFTCTQDEIDELRSRRFPRQAQDQQFLEEARRRLLDSFRGGAESARRDLRLLAVDLGEKGAHAAVYQGRDHQRDIPLKIVKIDRLYTELPDEFRNEKPHPRGLRKEHVARHLDHMAAGAAEIARHRQQEPGSVPATLEDHDFRGLKRHVAWMFRDWARHNAAQIVAAAEQQGCDLVVFESLRGFRLPGYEQMDPEKKRRLAMFAFGRIRRKVTEKAVERGMRVVTVPYFRSSQVCSTCGRVQQNAGRLRKNKKDRKFICEHNGCGTEMNCDANAARVLARVFWGEITLSSPEAAPAGSS